MQDISVLIIDDEPAVLRAVGAVLKREHMDVSCAGSGTLALEMLEARTYDIILLDVMMPEQDGFALLETLRRRKIYTPVIMLSGRAEDAAQVEGLKLGADDYITKPFSKSVLVSKIQAIMRRTSQYAAAPDSIQAPVQKGPFTLHMNSQTIWKDGREIALTSKEFALFCLLWIIPDIRLPNKSCSAKYGKAMRLTTARFSYISRNSAARLKTALLLRYTYAPCGGRDTSFSCRQA